MEGEGSACSGLELTEDQKCRSLRNKERAQALKKQSRGAKPYERPHSQETGKSPSSSSSRDPLPRPQAQPAGPNPPHFRNSHAGFIYEEEGGATQSLQYRRVEDDGTFTFLYASLPCNRPTPNYSVSHIRISLLHRSPLYFLLRDRSLKPASLCHLTCDQETQRT